jgi:beta-phosphoglucomutase-like phosphatase (HAD superfamily)
VKLLADNRIPVDIVTGAQHEDVLAVLDGSPTGELITILIAEEDVSIGKPHPEGLSHRSANPEPQARRCAVLRRFGARRRGRGGCGHALHRRLRGRARP